MMRLDRNKVRSLEEAGASDSVKQIIIKDLKWSLKPLFNWAKLAAVLPFADNERGMDNRELIISLIYRYLAWLLALSAHSSYLFYFIYWDSPRFFSTGKGAGVFSKVTTNWKLLINSINWMIHSFCTHTIILFVFSKKLKTLLKSLERTNLQLQHLIDFVFLRKLCWIGVCYIFLSEGGIIALHICEIEMTVMKPTLVRKLITTYCYVTKIHPTTAIIIFCILSLVISQQLNGIRSQVKSLMVNYNQLESENEGKRILLSNLQRQHVQIHYSLALLNRCFGLILLIEIPFNFMGMINVTMSFYMNASVSSLTYIILLVVLLINYSVNVTLVCLCSDKISSQHNRLEMIFFRLSDCNPQLKPEIQSFTAQLAQLSPGVSGKGYIKIGKKLIPAIIGTVITYFLIMIDFFNSEAV